MLFESCLEALISQIDNSIFFVCLFFFFYQGLKALESNCNCLQVPRRRCRNTNDQEIQVSYCTMISKCICLEYSPVRPWIIFSDLFRVLREPDLNASIIHNLIKKHFKICRRAFGQQHRFLCSGEIIYLVKHTDWPLLCQIF